jgi:hypothetical protein
VKKKTTITKFTNADFIYFVKEFRRWATVFALHDWDFCFVWADIKDKDGENVAQIDGNMESMVCAVYFCHTLHNSVDEKCYGKKKLIAETAKHEVLEVLLYPLTCRMKSQTEAHRIIHRIEGHLSEGLVKDTKSINDGGASERG